MIGLMVFTALSFGLVADSHLITPTARELEMMNEVNYVRTNPAEYAKYITEFIEYWESDDEEMKAAAELKKILLSMTPVDSVKWSPELYHDAFTHGNWMKKNNKFEHSDYDWAENLVCGNEGVRMSLLDLLIDGGVESRGHRTNILAPEHLEFSCYELIGTVEDCPFVFVQEFN